MLLINVFLVKKEHIEVAELLLNALKYNYNLRKQSTYQSKGDFSVS